ncbi:hypothetical protein EV683_11830 [Crenobacter luteus]|uniref:hypothetical protein n=1 Tax=Crenobacter luteus TaxID=1452487 RepID=UPI001053D4E8|nr:hypothetical protein [Crenobacter luteus]TCP10834.1 hypothetical protein EV683_11830 [Crenobacter luteus]
MTGQWRARLLGRAGQWLQGRRLQWGLTVAVTVCVVGAAAGQLALDAVVSDWKARQQFRVEAFQLANELRGSTERLTASARSYVATRDRRFYDDYFSALEIRSGRRPRPGALAQISWGFFVPARTGARAEPFEQLLEQADFTREEKMLLLRAKAASDALSRKEASAMRLMEQLGFRPDPADEARARQQAQQLLFAPGYNLAKREVMVPLSRFDEGVSQRLKVEVDALDAEIRALRYLSRSLAALGAALALWGLWRTRRAYEARLMALSHACEEVVVLRDLTLRLNAPPVDVAAEGAFNRLLAGQEGAFRDIDRAAAALEEALAELEARLADDAPPARGAVDALKARARTLRHTVLGYRF